MIKQFISQNITGGTTISYVIGATLFSKGVSELVYVDETNAHHLLKRWNNELITNFTIEVPKNILTSGWGLQLKLINPDKTQVNILQFTDSPKPLWFIHFSFNKLWTFLIRLIFIV